MQEKARKVIFAIVIVLFVLVGVLILDVFRFFRYPASTASKQPRHG